jgi:hypothetical protein
MAIIALNFNNKNQFRKYPFKQSSASTSRDGYILDDDVFVNCSITSVYGKHRIYVAQIFYKNNHARITVASSANDEVLGYFSGDVFEDFTTLTLTPFVRNVSGSLTVGSFESLSKINRVLSFKSSALEFEESVIFCYTPPAVSSIRDKKESELRGYVNFGQLINLSKTTYNSSSTTKFTALNPASIFNLADRSSYLGNCPTPIVQTINGVKPFEAEGNSINDNNIYILGILPIVFYGIPIDLDEFEFVDGIISTGTQDVSLDSLCAKKHLLLPPVDVSAFTLPTIDVDGDFMNRYYNKPDLPRNDETGASARLAGNFATILAPEFYFWPQFVREEYYTKYWDSAPED